MLVRTDIYTPILKCGSGSGYLKHTEVISWKLSVDAQVIYIKMHGNLTKKHLLAYGLRIPRSRRLIQSPRSS